MKKKTLVALGIIVVVGVASGIYFGTPKKSPAPEIPEAMLFDVEEAANIVLDDQSTKLQETRKEQEATREKANGTGETAPIETSHDLAYEQQLAKENNRPVADVTITMYAAKDCGVFSAPSESGKEVSTLKKGDKVIVSKVGDWHTVELDDGEEGFVKKENLSDTMPGKDDQPGKDQGESASKDKGNTGNGENQGESASKNNGNGGNNGGNGGNSQSAPTPETPSNGNGESASSQPTPAPAPEPQPQPAPAPEQPQASSGGISDAERDALIQMAIDAGATVGDVTGEVGEFHIDGQTSVDISGVTLH